MNKIHTHYDNLKVARNAPFEVIRSAYKALSYKYHPDRNPNNPDADRIMSIINESYVILSDPEKRKQHDIWIETQEQCIENKKQTNEQYYHFNTESDDIRKTKTHSSVIKIVFNHIISYWLLYGVIIFFIWLFIDNSLSTPPKGPKPYSKDPIISSQSPKTNQYGSTSPEDIPTFNDLFDAMNTKKVIQNKPISPVPLNHVPITSTQSKYIRSENAPNGTPWPQISSYIHGYKILNNDGLSKVTIDNSQNNSDVFVKLVSLNGPKAYPVRNIFILAYEKFTLDNVTAGKYDIRYRDLNSGHLARSESFDVDEISTYNSINYSDITMTLYKVLDGNMETYDLAESEF